MASKDASKSNGAHNTSSRGSISIIGDAIHAETIKKELRCFRLNEKYMLSPSAIKNLVFTNKPTNPILPKDTSTSDADDEVRGLKSHSVGKPRGADETPVTSSSVYGWDTQPLVRFTDRRFYHPKTVTEITKMYGTSVVPGNKSSGQKNAAAASGGAA